MAKCLRMYITFCTLLSISCMYLELPQRVFYSLCQWLVFYIVFDILEFSIDR